MNIYFLLIFSELISNKIIIKILKKFIKIFVFNKNILQIYKLLNFYSVIKLKILLIHKFFFFC